MTSTRWTKEHIKLAFNLYCQIPYGRIHGRNPEIMALAAAIGRTADAVAMKMLNIASLDPAIIASGRAGLGNASSLDKEIWSEFHADWEQLAVESEQLMLDLHAITHPSMEIICDENKTPEDFTGETRRVMTEQRIKQNFFRRAVLSSYQGRCCMSGLSEPRLLIASHIVPWSKDKANRLNPSNGLCLSAIHDRAFDKGLITLSNEFTIVVAQELMRRDEVFVREVIAPLHGKPIAMPERFMPDAGFIAMHRNEVFIER